jgi:hypothetical protein
VASPTHPATFVFTTVVSSGIEKVFGDPVTQSVPESPWQRSAVVCVTFQVASES